MTSPRYVVHPPLADALVSGGAVFCDQVGKADIYINRTDVIEIVRHWQETMPLDKHGSSYSYYHAGLKYPRIAHKLRAMRAMTWGHEE